MHLQKQRWDVLIFLFIATYFFLFLLYPNFGPVDDHYLLKFLRTGQFYPLAIFPDQGRFYPLHGQEYNLIAWFTLSPFWFYFYNACQFVIFTLILIHLLRRLKLGSKSILAILVVVTLSPGFTIAWFRLLVPDRDAAFFLAVFLLTYLRFLHRPSLFLGLGTLLAANLALYYKEPIFLCLGTFAAAHLLLAWKSSSWKLKLLDSLLLVSSGLFLLAYYGLVYLHQGENLYSQTDFNPLVLTAKTLVYYSLSNPLLILLLLPLSVVRGWQLWRQQTPAHPIYDSLGLAATVYVLGLLALNLKGFNLPLPYVLLPPYSFALPALVYWGRTSMQALQQWRFLLVMIAIVLLTNTLPTGIHELSYWKYVPINYNAMLDGLVQELRSHDLSRPVSLHVGHLASPDDTEVTVSLTEFLQFKGLTHQDFELDLTPTAIEEGKIDYLILTPDVMTDIDPAYLQMLEPQYRLILSTRSDFLFPNLNWRSAVKYLFLRLASPQQHQAATQSGLLQMENLLHLPNYYVLSNRADEETLSS